MDEDSNKRKPHRTKKSGRKAEKKEKKNEATKAVSQAGMTAKQKNPKAFAIQNVTKLRKKVRRTLDIKEKKIHDPVVDRTPLEPPPIIVAIVGPPKVGKTTLMRGLLKNYAAQKLSDIKGPVTVVSGKKRRLTFIECNNDMNSMIDVAKVADLVLLLIDASFGMEMETFEFLNICQVHGFPRIMGVLTHLDYFKNNKKLKVVRKTLKHRFWTEIYQGAKLFYLSGMVYGEYLKNEVHNLARFISVMKFRPLVWRNSHPYILADRMEDITDPEKLRLDSKTNRNVSFYGWMRGVPLKNKSTIHIPGCGDFQISDVSNLPDPCPLPDLTKRRSLNEMERKIYAPLSGVGGVVYDKDAVYIDMGNSQQHQNKQQQGDEDLDSDEEGAGDMKAAMISSQKTLDEKITESSLSIFADSKAITSKQFQELSVNTPDYETVEESGRTRRRAVFSTKLPETGHKGVESGSDDDMSDDEEIDMSRVMPLNQTLTDVAEDENSDGGESDEAESDAEDEEDMEEGEVEEEEEEEESSGILKWKDNLVAKASQAFLDRQKSTPNLRKLVYELDPKDTKEEHDNTNDVGGMFKVITTSQKNTIDNNDTTRMLISAARDWSNSDVTALIRDCFVTGEWEASKDAQKILDEDDEMFGDFEDLEKPDADSDDDEAGDDDNEGGDSGVEGEDDDEDGPLDGNTQRSKKLTKEDRKKRVEEKRNAKKARIKQMFDQEYDKATQGDGAESLFDARKAQLDDQARLNRNEFEGMDDDLRVLYEGYRSGMYVRVEIQDMPCEFVTNFDPTAPVILGGMTSTETVIGTLQARFKKHRWYDKILKTKDPLIFSLGWRRFQSIPLYTIQDHNGRNRHLKYTPEHMHCNAIFWGPSTPQNTGLMCLQHYSADHKGFRVCATGVILQQDKSMAVMKKLKLIGYPLKVHKKTAFIKDMFSSQLEIAKFEGAKIKTVSGIRGQVKKALRTPEGAFRATFEDTILNSDIVFLKTWYQVEIPKFYNPVTNMLMSSDERAEWKGMKTLGMLRKEKGVKAPFSADSQYQPEAVRKKHNLKPLVIPKKLQKNLPFDYKPKVRSGKHVDPVLSKRVAVVRDTHERKRDQLLNQMRMISTAQEMKNREGQQKRHQAYRNKKKAEEAGKAIRQKKAKKEIFTKLGKVKESQDKKRRNYEAAE